MIVILVVRASNIRVVAFQHFYFPLILGSAQ